MITDSQRLRRGETKSCGCLRREITDISGMRFGRLTAICPTGWKYQDNQTAWLCRCDCGRQAVASVSNLNRGAVKSCGCMANDHHYENLSGKRFGMVVPLRFIGNAQNRGAVWECKCDCGNIKNIRASDLKKGSVKSCGCMQLREVLAKMKSESEHVLMFLDGDIRNKDTRNIVLTSKKVRNNVEHCFSAHQTGPEIIRAALLNAELKTMIDDIEHPDKKGATP